MPAIAVAGIYAAGAIASAKMASNASKEAAATQTAAGNQALRVQQDMWNQQRGLQQPYVDAGNSALNRVSDIAARPRMPMPMFNPQQMGGGWTPQNFAQQQPNPYQKLYQAGAPPLLDPFAGGR